MGGGSVCLEGGDELLLLREDDLELVELSLELLERDGDALVVLQVARADVGDPDFVEY